MIQKKIVSLWTRHKALVTVIVIVQIIAFFLLMTESGHRRDERVHSHIVKKMYTHKVQSAADLENLTNIPGYHYALVTVARGVNVVLGGDYKLKHRHIRYMSVTIFGSMFFIALYGLVRMLRQREEVFFVIVTLPIVFLFSLLVYTDIAAIALFLVGYWALLRQRHAYAALAFITTLLVRQDMVLFIAAIVAIDMVQCAIATCKNSAPAIVRTLAHNIVSLRYVPYYVVAGLFVAFVLINGGVAMSDRQAHPVGALHAGNIYFALITFALMLAPVVVAHIPRMWVAMMTHSWRYRVGVIMLVIIGWFLYDTTFIIDHVYNFVVKERFLHNDILIAIAAEPWAHVLSYGVVILAMGTLASMRWRDAVAVRIFAPFVLLALSLHWLIEPRYALLPIIMALLWMRLSRRMMWVQIIYAVVLCVIVYAVFIAKDNYFL